MIEVRISDGDLARHRLVMDTPYILSRLRAAGVPVLGLLSFGGLERGVLTGRYEYDTGEIVYTWSDLV